MLEIGARAPEFELLSHEAQQVKLSSLIENAKALVLAFYLFDFSHA